MAAWELIPCLAALREEFNDVAPSRDKGADGSIGDRAHSSSSDHTPDEDSAALRGRDADSRNEVHALDIDSTGPWPSRGWFNAAILALVERERAEYLSTHTYGRLQYVIWNRRIASRSYGWQWRPYSGTDPHTNHAHFSARYLSRTEADTRPWGVSDDMPSVEDVWKTDNIIKAPNNTASAGSNPYWQAGSFLTDIAQGWRQIKAQTNNLAAMSAAIKAIGSAVSALAKAQGQDTADLSAQLDALAAQVEQVDEQVIAGLQDAGRSPEEIADALRAVLGARAAEVGALLSQ